MKVIIWESAQIAAILFIVIIFQTLIFIQLDANSDTTSYVGFLGFFMAFIDSYRLALGDFSITAIFEDNPNIYIFWLIFCLTTFISLLIILNMVIAVMSSAFEKVEESNEAHILKEKLGVILENWYRMDDRFKKELTKHKYLIIVKVDPDVCPVLEKSSEERIKQEIQMLQETVLHISEEQQRTHFNIDSLSKRQKIMVKNHDEIMKKLNVLLKK